MHDNNVLHLTIYDYLAQTRSYKNYLISSSNLECDSIPNIYPYLRCAISLPHLYPDILVRISNKIEKLYFYLKNSPNGSFLRIYKPEKDDLPGGNAKQFDWSLLSDLNINKPWFLSGGINKSNINKIKNYVNPNGIDLSSGVEEAPGIKNIKMINNLFKKYYAK